MREIEPTRSDLGWKRVTRSISAKLIGSLLAVMLVIFALLGYLNIRLHRQHLETATLTSAERVSDVIKRSTTYYMLGNDREGLYHAIQTIADEPGMVKVRILDQEGRISYSTDPAEVSHVLDKSAEACYGCHIQSQPLARLNRPDRFRIYRNGGGHRVLGVITPIENQPTCANAECHAHPASQQVLGVLDTNLSLATADAQLEASSAHMLAYTLGAGPASTFQGFGSWQLESALVDSLGWLWIAIPVVMAAAVALAAFAQYGRDQRLTGSVSPPTQIGLLMATILVFMLGYRVPSPQYMVWLLPFAALLPRSKVLVVGMACILTIYVYPFGAQGLIDLQTFPILVLALRNLMLFGLFAWLVAPGIRLAARAVLVRRGASSA